MSAMCHNIMSLPSASNGIKYLRGGPRPSTASDLGVCEWSPEGLYDKTVSWIPNTDEILKFVKRKMN